VIQLHYAKTTHYDFRLERDGVLKSWAIPKGLPVVPNEKRLAIEVDDHALDYANFEGEIPAGQYGAGRVEIWDRGTYQFSEWSSNRIRFSLDGQRMKGNYCLIRFRPAGPKEWLIFLDSSG